ncbi:uncharacterized protein LOC143240476 isoform X2 [Tachypleus tridentatus]|uniref:uncharacterized protein LOC143240476 isoform X2 n=1 Tax=Tachypleus tridentatus TaxID=6853 RepID=UPI003FD19185
MGTRDTEYEYQPNNVDLRNDPVPVFHVKGSTPKSRYKFTSCLCGLEKHLSENNANSLPCNFSCFKAALNSRISLSVSEMDEKQSPLETNSLPEISGATPYNPFYTEPDTLHLPAFSPSVFASTKETKSNETKPFRWSIDQLAVLKPADIDETSQQDTYSELDELVEERAQRAIEKFFSQKHIVPSPWAVSTKHVIFSPNLASTAYYTELEESLNSSQQCSEPSTIPKKAEVWTQTVLTIPPAVDLLGLLGRFFTFKEEQFQQLTDCSAEHDSCDAVDSLSTSSLRRKLFFQGDNEYPPSPVRKNEKTGFPTSPGNCCTPEKQDFSNAHTPGTQFSSSPITPKNCSIPFNVAGFTLSPPSVSPIGKSVFKTPSTGSGTEGVSVIPKSSSSSKVSSLGSTCVEEQNKESRINTKSKDTDARNDFSSSSGSYGTPMSITSQMMSSGVVLSSMLISETSALKPLCRLPGGEKTRSMERLTEENANASTTGPDEVLESCPAHSIHMASLMQNTNSELLQDTGYQTGSLQHTASLSGQEITKSKLRITPAADLMDSCVISHSPMKNKCMASVGIVCSDSVSKAGNRPHCDMTFTRDNILSENVPSREEKKKSCGASLMSPLHHHPSLQGISKHSLWKPSVFSTPTKQHLMEEDV